MPVRPRSLTEKEKNSELNIVPFVEGSVKLLKKLTDKVILGVLESIYKEMLHFHRPSNTALPILSIKVQAGTPKSSIFSSIGDLVTH